MVFLNRSSHEFGFSGGMVDTASPTTLDTKEVISARNLVGLKGKVTTRPAIEIVNPGGLGDLDPANYKLRSAIMHIDPESQARTLIAGCYAGFAKLNATTGIFEYIPVLSGLILGSYRPWFRCQTLGASYWCRDDSGGILRASPEAVGRAGITQPSAAPTLANGGAGTMDAGDYQVVVRFKNSRTGAISNYSDPSAAITQAGSRKITVTGIQTSTDWQVDSRELAITVANRPGTYYYAATLADNLSTGPVTIDLVPSQLGDPFDRRNDPPPGNAKVVAWWDAAQALVCSDGKSLFISETGLPESFSDNIYDFGADDGFSVTGLLPLGQRVLVGKPNRVDMISGLSRADFKKDVLTDNYGVAAGLTMRSVGSTAFWLAMAKDGLCVVRADGGTVTTVNDDKVDAILARVPVASIPLSEAWVYPRYNLYILSLSQGQEFSDESRYVPEVALAYDYKNGRWFKWDFDPRFLGYPDPTSFTEQVLAPLSYCDWYEGEGSEVVGYLIFDYSKDTSGSDTDPIKPWEFIYSLTGEGSDPGGAIPWVVRSRTLTPTPGKTHKPDTLYLRADCLGKQRRITVRQYKNGAASGTQSDQYDLPDRDGAVEYRLPIASRDTLQLGTGYQIEIEGSGQIELHDDSHVEMAESGVRHTVLSVTAKDLDDTIEGGE